MGFWGEVKGVKGLILRNGNGHKELDGCLLKVGYNTQHQSQFG